MKEQFPLDDRLLKELTELARKVDFILREELKKGNSQYDYAEARMLNTKAVGVQGDKRTYGWVTTIDIRKNGKPTFDYDLIRKISTRITNEIEQIGRVQYVPH